MLWFGSGIVSQSAKVEQGEVVFDSCCIGLLLKSCIALSTQTQVLRAFSSKRLVSQVSLHFSDSLLHSMVVIVVSSFLLIGC